MKIFGVLILKLLFCLTLIQAQLYEDARCKCVCNVRNETQTYKVQFVTNVPPNNDCDSVTPPPEIGRQGNNQIEGICPRCQCKYESRNTTIIKVVVIIVVWVISLLMVYMMFLICLDPLLNNRLRGSNYMEHTNEEVCSLLDDYYSDQRLDESPDHRSEPFGRPHQMSISGGVPSGSSEGNSTNNVLNRVSHQQDKWKKQVREQRKHIYDQHTMLN